MRKIARVSTREKILDFLWKYIKSFLFAGIAQLARVPPCHGGRCEFESHYLLHMKKRFSTKVGNFISKRIFLAFLPIFNILILKHTDNKQYMDSINIIQPSAFIFFILVITIGYILVEIIWWDGYWLKESIRRYTGSNIMDRLIHYISIGILFHFIVIIIISLVGKTELVDQIMLIWYNFSQDIHFIDGEKHFDTLLNVQLIVSSLLYFTFIIMLFIAAWIWTLLWKLLAFLYTKFWLNKKPIKKSPTRKNNREWARIKKDI